LSPPNGPPANSIDTDCRWPSCGSNAKSRVSNPADKPMLLVVTFPRAASSWMA